MQFLKIPVAGSGIEPCLPGVVRVEHSPRERVLRADINACGAVAAAWFHRRPGRFEGSVGEHAHPPDTGTVIRGDEKAALSYPPQACKMCGELVREDRTYLSIVGAPGCRNGECMITFSLEDACQADRDLVE